MRRPFERLSLRGLSPKPDPGRGRGRYTVPRDVLHALETVFDEPNLDRISILYRPWYVQGHLAFIGARFGSVTRPGRIYTSIPEELFFRFDAHVLHEFFHVVQQWGRERMTTLGYLLHSRQREREARDFVGANLERYVDLRKAAARRAPSPSRSRPT